MSTIIWKSGPNVEEHSDVNFNSEPPEKLETPSGPDPELAKNSMIPFS